MASTIKLKNGSGAPLAGDLVQGEPALDLTNKRLYTEDSGGNVIEVGTNPSSLTIGGTALTATAAELNTLDGITATVTELNYTDGVTSNIQTQLNTKAPIASPTFTGTVTAPAVNVNGTVTADGLTVQGATNSTVLVEATGGNDASLFLTEAGTGNVGAQFVYDGGDNNLYLKVGNNTNTNRLSVSRDTGDISFYEDTGTTAKFFWDASAESLGIGTTSPSTTYGIDSVKPFRVSSTAPNLTLQETDASNQQWQVGSFAGDFAIRNITASTYPVTVDTSGNVGIGTNVPTGLLDVEDNTGSLSATKDITAEFHRRDGTYSPRLQIRHSTEGTDLNATYSNVAANKLMFSVGNNEHMRIDSSGRVGIGTTSPLASLHVKSASGASRIRVDDNTSTYQYYLGNDGSDNLLQVASKDAIKFQTGSSFTERMRITSAGNVGIGTNSPTEPLTVNGDIKSYENYNGSTEIGCRLSNSASFAGISAPHIDMRRWTGSGTTHGTGAIAVLNDASMRFYTGYQTTNTASNAERARIDSSGNLLVGKTSTSIATEGAVFGNGQHYLTTAGDAAVKLNRLTSDGDIINLRKDGTTVGSIGSISGEFYIAHDNTFDSGLRFRNGIIQPCNASGGSNDAAVSLGQASMRFSDLYLSGGVYLGGTGAANLLDDYEEGTWTPALTNAGTPTYTRQVGHYTKVGRLVTAHLKLEASSITSSTNNIIISGLPFTGDNTGDAGQRSFGIIGGDWTGMPSNVYAARLRIDGNTLQGVIDDGTGDAILWKYDTISSSVEFHTTVTYYTS